MQISNYILGSLVLAVFHVCGCTLVWKLCILPNTKKPSFLLRLLFVRCLRRTFWLRFLRHCFCFNSTCAPSNNLSVCHRANCTEKEKQEIGPTEQTEPIEQTKPTEHTERTELTAYKTQLIVPNRQDVMGIGRVEDITPTSHEKLDPSNRELSSIWDHPPEKHVDLESWTAVALGINSVINTIYILGNLLVFALYMCPLLYRIIVHSTASDYVADIN